MQQTLGHSDLSVTQRYSQLPMKTLNDTSNHASLIKQRAMQMELSEAVEVWFSGGVVAECPLRYLPDAKVILWLGGSTRQD